MKLRHTKKIWATMYKPSVTLCVSEPASRSEVHLLKTDCCAAELAAAQFYVPHTHI